MELALLLATFTALWEVTRGQVQCYKCEPMFPASGYKTNLCQDFQEDPIFMVNCPKSSMCFKKVITMTQKYGDPTTSIQRGCAPQTTTNEQKKIGHKWVPQSTIHEVYPDECQVEDMDPDRPVTTTRCYCHGNLCNGAMGIKYRGFFRFICVIFAVIFNNIHSCGW